MNEKNLVLFDRTRNIDSIATNWGTSQNSARRELTIEIKIERMFSEENADLSKQMLRNGMENLKENVYCVLDMQNTHTRMINDTATQLTTAISNTESSIRVICD